MLISCRFPTLKAKPNNLFVVSLSMSGLLMMSKVPIFLLNLHHGGPHSGQLGAQVKTSQYRRCLSESVVLARLFTWREIISYQNTPSWWL